MKMNKKGFTLVELLAVIAILAILILLVTPNILSMFNEGKESVFVQQGQRILDASNTKYVNLSLKKSGSYVFTNLDTNSITTTTAGETLDNLNLTSNSVKYCVKVSSTGKVTYLHISDDNYSIKITNANGISLDDINKTETDNKDKYVNLKVNGEDTGENGYSAVSFDKDTAKTCN